MNYSFISMQGIKSIADKNKESYFLPIWHKILDSLEHIETSEASREIKRNLSNQSSSSITIS
jgi:hypothetical protein